MRLRTVHPHEPGVWVTLDSGSNCGIHSRSWREDAVLKFAAKGLDIAVAKIRPTRFHGLGTVLATTKYNIPFGHLMANLDEDDVKPRKMVFGVIQSWEADMDGKHTCLFSQQDMANLGMVINSRTGVITSGMYPGSKFEIARDPQGMLMMRIDYVNEQWAEKTGSKRLKMLIAGNRDRPIPAEYNEHGQLIYREDDALPTEASRWDRQTIESDSDDEYTDYMKSEQRRVDSTTGRTITFKELRAQNRTTQAYLTRQQLVEQWRNCSTVCTDQAEPTQERHLATIAEDANEAEQIVEDATKESDVSSTSDSEGNDPESEWEQMIFRKAEVHNQVAGNLLFYDATTKGLSLIHI